MKKIAIFHNYMDNIGGAEIVGLTLARELNADFYTTNIDEDKIKKMGFSDIKLKSIGKIPANAPFRQQAALWRFRKLNLKGRYDFFIIDGDWAVSGAVNNKPNLWYVHSPIREIWDLYKYIRQNIVPFPFQWIFSLWVYYNRYLNKKYIRCVNKIACNSENTKERVKKYLQREAVVINPPIETSSHYYQKAGDYWLSVNRLFYHKRIDMQMKAFSRLPDKKLIIVGSYEYSRNFLKYTAYLKQIKPKNVEIKSFVDVNELKELYANCKGFIATAMDEDFGMTVCLPGGNNIITREGIRDIKDIEIGDKVLTHEGIYSEVINKFKRKVNEQILAITPLLSNIPITVTKNHPILAMKTEKCVRQKNQTVCKPNCQKKDYINKKLGQSMGCQQRLYLKYKPKWVCAEKLREGDVVLYPIIRKTKDIKSIDLFDLYEKKGMITLRKRSIIHKTSRSQIGIPRYIKVNKNFMRFLGYYLGDGWFNKKLYNIGISINSRDKEIVEDIKGVIKKEFGLLPKERERNNAIEISINNIFLVKLLLKYCGHGAGNKFIHKKFINLPEAKLKELIKGLWRTDGYIHKTKFYTSYQSISRKLINDIKLILIKLGVVPTIKIQKIRGFGKEKSFRLIIMGEQFMKMMNILGESIGGYDCNKKTYQRFWKDKNYVYIPIRKIKKINFKGEVYNFEVKKQNSYVGETLCFHNCEAMASGKPVIAGNEGGYKETVIDGITGKLIDNINVDKLVEAIKEIGKNPEKYKNACFEQAKKFDTKIFIKKIKEAIENKC